MHPDQEICHMLGGYLGPSTLYLSKDGDIHITQALDMHWDYLLVL